jgi:hypothetical protein
LEGELVVTKLPAVIISDLDLRTATTHPHRLSRLLRHTRIAGMHAAASGILRIRAHAGRPLHYLPPFLQPSAHGHDCDGIPDRAAAAGVKSRDMP